MNLELDTINLSDINFNEMNSNVFLEFDNYSNNTYFDSSPDSLKFNDDLFLSIFSPANSDLANVLDHSYCLMPEKHEFISDLKTPEFISDLKTPEFITQISDDQLDKYTGISFADIEFGNISQNIFTCPNSNSEIPNIKEQISLNKTTPASYFINSDIESDYLSKNSSEIVQNMELINTNDCNVIISEEFDDCLNTFEIEDEYETLSDHEDIIMPKLKTKAHKKNFLPMTLQDLKPDRRTRFKDNCQLLLTQEEKFLLSQQGFNLPTDVPLTREEDRILKAVRRKLRNKYAAKMSRLKKQDYMEGLEKRVKYCTSQNQQLQYKVVNLEKQNSILMNQLKQLQNLISKNNPLSSESMESLGRFASNKHAQTGTCFMVLILSFSFFILPNLTPFFATKPDSLPLFGNSRKILQLNSPPELLKSNTDEFELNHNILKNYLDQDLIIDNSSGQQLRGTDRNQIKYKQELNYYENFIEDDKDSAKKVDYISTDKNVDQDFEQNIVFLGIETKELGSTLKNPYKEQEIKYQHISNNISVDKSITSRISNHEIDYNSDNISMNTNLELKEFDFKNQNITNLSLVMGEKDL